MSLHILVMNQRRSVCDFLSALLAGEGHTPHCARDLKEVYHAEWSVGLDLVLMEITKADVGAVDSIQRLQRDRVTGHVPIIVMSDCPDLEFELLNVFDFLALPLDLARLREDLRMLGEGRKKRPQDQHLEPFTGKDQQLFHDYLVAHTGLYFERRNVKILEKGLTARMAALRIGSYREYFDYLTRHQNDRQELHRLLPFLTVGETYFFRYHAHFEALRKFLLTEVAGKANQRVRLWSAGCSTGEEAYSMAITVMETLPDWRQRDIRILATDLNNRSLHKAREGVYSTWAMRVIEQRYVQHYFEQVGKSYILNDDVKSLVQFSHQNLQADDFPGKSGDFRDIDVIFCRNVMIYFSLATTRHIVEKFAATLVPGGLLFLGHAETLMQISSRFERHCQGGGFYYREKQTRPLQEPEHKGAIATSSPPVPASGVPNPQCSSPVLVATTAPEVKPEQSDAVHLFSKAETLFEAEQFEEASAVTSLLLRLQPRHTGALILKGFIAANTGHLDQALLHGREALGINDLLPEAYLLLGMVFDMTDRTAEAMEEYRKAILLKMDFVVAHYYLARLSFRLGDTGAGQRQLRNALKVLEKGQTEKVIPLSGGLSREVFLQQVRGELAKAV